MNAAVPRIDKLVVVGVGLIGGSFALALKAAGQVDTVVGVGRGRANLDAAAALGIIDRAITIDADWTRELADADLVLLATPVAQFPALFAAMAGRLPPQTILTDAGSTKQNVIAAARRTLARRCRASSRGIRSPAPSTRARRPRSRRCTRRNVVLTPLPETDPLPCPGRSALDRVRRRVHVLDPVTHDRIFAAVSHLPHVLAFALVDQFAARPMPRSCSGTRRRVSRFHADRRQLAGDVARHRARESRRAPR